MSGRIETIGLTHYFVPDTKRGQRQFAAAMRRRFIGSFDERFDRPSDDEFDEYVPSLDGDSDSDVQTSFD